MKSVYKPNISKYERFFSTAVGATLAVMGARRSNRLVGLAGASLMARGFSGWCPVSAATGRDTASYDTKHTLGGGRGTIVEDAITIHRPADEVYRHWRQLENLPGFMTHLIEVQETGGNLSHWVARGPMDSRVEWDAEIISDIPGNLISWRTVGNADVTSAGSVRFRRIGDNATQVRVRLQYEPPAGRAGAAMAEMLGEDPRHQIAEDLRRFKDLLETGRRGSWGSSASTPERGFREGASGIVTDPMHSTH
jgi:uncharacterized membrane protein